MRYLTLVFCLIAGMSLSSAASALVCPVDFLEVSNSLGELGCIQADVERTTGGSVVQRSWPDAVRACFADYGGRLPSPGEFTIAESVVTLVSPTAPTWTDNVFFDPSELAVTTRILGPGNVDYGSSLLTTNGFQRCWIPPEAQILSTVPTFGRWSLGALILLLALAGVASIGRVVRPEEARFRSASTG